MNEDDALSVLSIAADEIARLHGVELEKREDPSGRWVVSIETDDWTMTGEGRSEAQALSDFIMNAQGAA